MVVVALEEPSGRQTGRLDRAAEYTANAQDTIRAFLDDAGIARSEYLMSSPTVMGTFRVQATDGAVKAIRRAPGVEAVTLAR